MLSSKNTHWLVLQAKQAPPSGSLLRTNLLANMCLSQLAERVDKLGISPGSYRRSRPEKKRPYRGGRRKQGRTIPNRAELSPSATDQHHSPGLTVWNLTVWNTLSCPTVQNSIRQIKLHSNIYKASEQTSLSLMRVCYLFKIISSYCWLCACL